jgi:3-oxoacyl-[acyl-carrier protein] reductase
MDLGLTGKSALVTAASKGLGKAAALALAREGTHVTICARTAAGLDAATRQIRAETGQYVHAVQADISTAAGVTAAVSAAAAHSGGIDVLVINSAPPPMGSFDALGDDDWRQAFEAVTLAFTRLVREAVPVMRDRGWGRVITIQSSSVKQPAANIDLSNGTRPGVAGLMKAIMPGLARDGITINMILPGLFATSRVTGAPDGEPAAMSAEHRQRAATIPLGRLGNPAELGALVAFLASEQASYITGAVYQVDGGLIKSVW